MAAMRVDFYLYASHEVATWLPLIDELRRRDIDARYVLEPPGVNLTRGSSPDPKRNWHDDKSSRAVPLVDAAQHRLLASMVSEVGHEPLTRLRPGADAVVMSSGYGWTRCWHGARVRCMYGVGLVTRAWGHGDVNEGYDLVLAPGDFSRREILSAVPDANVAVVGYPKWAAHRSDPPAAAEARHLLGIADDPSAPVIVWLPTWADHSSLDRYAPAFADLASTHRVVIKPHNNSVRFESERLDALVGGHGSVDLTPVDTDLRTLVAAADVVVSDVRSGGLTEALLGDRPVVALTDGALTPDELHPAGAEAVTLCTAPSDLSAAVERALGDQDRSARQELVLDLFGPGEGNDTVRAVDEMMTTIRQVGHPVARRLTSPVYRAAYRLARRIGR